MREQSNSANIKKLHAPFLSNFQPERFGLCIIESRLQGRLKCLKAKLQAQAMEVDLSQDQIAQSHIA